MTIREKLRAVNKTHAAASSVVILGLTVGGYLLAGAISQPPAIASTTTLPPHTVVVRHTRVVKKIVRGRVVTLKGGTRVIRVPLVIIHNLKCHPTRHHHCVRRVVVPAHTIPLRAATPTQAATAVAAPLIPVTVYVTVPVSVPGPTTTVTAPPVTVTLPQDTTTVFVPTTITVPLQP